MQSEMKGERLAPLSPSRLPISSNHMYLGCSFMKTELALSLCVGLSVGSARRWLCLSCLRANGKE